MKAFFVSYLLLIQIVLYSQDIDSVKIARLLKQCELSFQENKLEQCRDSAELILQIDKLNCSAYMILGKIYSNIPQYYLKVIMKEQIEYKMIYCLAVDMFEKAKEVDTLCKTRADQEIAIYSKYFPISSWESDANILGQEYFIEGWINRTTTIRYRN
jgi:hypothetical protein